MFGINLFSSNNVISQIRSSYTQEKKEFLKRFFWCGTVTPILAMPFTAFFLKFRISATQVTILSICAVLGGLILVTTGYFVLGALLLNVWIIMDDIDGQIARTTKTTSRKGRFLDNFGAYLTYAFLFPTISYGLFFGENQWLFYGASLSKFWFLIFGHVTAILILFKFVIVSSYAKIYNDSKKRDVSKPLSQQLIDRQSNLKKFKDFILWCNLNFTELAGFPLLILLLSAIFDLVSFYLVIMFTFNLFNSFLEIFRLFRNLN